MANDANFFHSLAIGQVSPEAFINKDYHKFLLKTKVGEIPLEENFLMLIYNKYI